MTDTSFRAPSGFAASVRENQARLANGKSYDFIVCGAGSSGSVVARRLAENPDVKVLLIEAGGDDDVPEVVVPLQLASNLGSDRDWGFVGAPSPLINSRSVMYSMGKVLGGGSSINFMAWAQGHRADWNFFAEETGNPAWNYESVRDLYRRIEDWQGQPDPSRRGVGGPIFVAPPEDPHPVAPALVDAAETVGIPKSPSVNGRAMEGPAGVALADLRIRNGQRQTMFRSYTYPYMDRANLTVWTHAELRTLVIDGSKIIGVEIEHRGAVRRINVDVEVILSLGAINTPKVLMQSGIGDERELRQFGITVRQHSPGVGQNFQDHVSFDCIWEYPEVQPPKTTFGEVLMFGSTVSSSVQPDVFAAQIEIPYTTPENAEEYGLPMAGWTLHGALSQPKSRGRVALTGPAPNHQVLIEANSLAEPEDMKTAVACVEWCREIGNAAPLRPFVKREVMPGNLKGVELERFIRNAATTFFHPTGTAKMGRDDMSVVDGHLKVYGYDNLRIADGSIMPRITSLNTMAPCVVIGEHAAAFVKDEHDL